MPPTCVIGDKLALNKSAFYLYDTKSDSWSTSTKHFFTIEEGLPPRRLPFHFVTVYDGSAYIVGPYEFSNCIFFRIDSLKLSIDSFSSISDCSIGSETRVYAEVSDSNEGAVRLLGHCQTPFENQVANGPYLTGFSHKDGTVLVEVMKLSSEKLERLIVHVETRCDVKDLCIDAKIGCFNIFNPNSLDKKFELAYTDNVTTQREGDVFGQGLEEGKDG